MNIQTALSIGAKRLAASPSASLDSRLLLSHVTGQSYAHFIAHPDEELSRDCEEAFEAALERRAASEPVAYITGEKAFYDSVFLVDSRVLIPRPESELLVEIALSHLAGAPAPRVLDMCCGSGAVGISIIRALGRGSLTLADISPAALEVARANARLLLSEGSDIAFVETDLYESLPKGAAYDAIAINPPYIPDGQIESLELSVKGFEPALALRGGADGLDICKRAIAGAEARLSAGGVFAMEVGAGQACPLAEMLEKTLADVRVHEDLAGIGRAISGTKKRD